MKGKGRFGMGLVTAFTVCALAAAGAGGQEAPKPAERFYFLGPHLFPFEQGISGLIAHDMNGDGKADLILMDNRSSRFHILLQKAGAAQEKAPEEAEWTEESVNELEPDRLLAKEDIPVSRPLLGYVVGGFAGSDAAIAYLSDGKELLIDRKDQTGKWETAQRFLLDLDSPFVGGFESADLDGNGKADLVLLSENAVLVLFQDKDGKLAEPRRYPVAREKPTGLVLADVNNDGRPDLLYVSPGTQYPLQVRLTQAGGSPGPEYRFRMPVPRRIAVGDCIGNGRNQIALIESTTNRVKVLQWEMAPPAQAGGLETGAFELVPLPKDEKAKMRSFAIADLDGDGLPDLTITEPGAARVSLIRSQRGPGLMPLESFPCLQEVSSMAALTAPDGVTDLILCSKKEAQVGLSRFSRDTGRLDYPKPIEVGGEPWAVAASPAAPRKRPYLYCSVRGPKKGTQEKGPVELVTLEREEHGYVVLRRQPLEGFKEPPARLLPVDADGDGLTDLLAFPEYESPLLLLQGRDGKFANASASPGFHAQLLRNLKGAAVDTVPPRRGERPAMFVGNENLVRLMRYDGANLNVEDQFSSENPRTSYVALGAADLDGDGEVEVLAADSTSKWLSVLKRDEKGVYQVARNIEIGPMEFLGLTATDVDGDGRPEVLLVGQDQLGVLFLSEGGPELSEVGSFETDQKDTAYAEVVIGDFNNDAKNDLLLREVQENHLEIICRQPDGKWKTGMRFKVFESHISERSDSRAPEPREVVAAELTGDGLTDIAIICHDRVIVYPEEASEGQTK